VNVKPAMLRMGRRMSLLPIDESRRLFSFSRPGPKLAQAAQPWCEPHGYRPSSRYPFPHNPDQAVPYEACAAGKIRRNQSLGGRRSCGCRSYDQLGNLVSDDRTKSPAILNTVYAYDL
jgi:hypothetical protein